jgi:hypothetical protein
LSQSRVLLAWKKHKNKHDKAPAKVDPASEDRTSYLKQQDFSSSIIGGNRADKGEYPCFGKSD